MTSEKYLMSDIRHSLCILKTYTEIFSVILSHLAIWQAQQVTFTRKTTMISDPEIFFNSLLFNSLVLSSFNSFKCLVLEILWVYD